MELICCKQGPLTFSKVKFRNCPPLDLRAPTIIPTFHPTSYPTFVSHILTPLPKCKSSSYKSPTPMYKPHLKDTHCASRPFDIWSHELSDTQLLAQCTARVTVERSCLGGARSVWCPGVPLVSGGSRVEPSQSQTRVQRPETEAAGRRA